MKKVDTKTLESALNAYKDTEGFIFPDEITLDDLQKQFVRGFLYAQQKEAGTRELEDEEIRQQILQVRSKYSEPILELLFREGELYHGDLAEKLELSPSGLSAIMKKMMEGTKPIIDMMQIGKYKIYMLPDAVKRYMERKTQPEEEQQTAGKVYEDNAVLILQHFVEKAGKNWKDVLNLLLQGKYDEGDEEVKRFFGELIKYARVEQEYETDSYETLKNMLRNDILEQLLDEYIEEIKECDRIMDEIRQRKNGNKLIRHFTMQ